ncbi:MAG: polyprenyl synthetase family protein [Sandaracinaceae bacterium]
MSGHLDEVRTAVERRLETFFHVESERLQALAPDAQELLGAVESLTMRGGKRFRPALLFAAYRAVHPEGTLGEVIDACAGLELLQSYLLIHDDWMDGDDERRGGPSVHAMLARTAGDAHLGASLAILAGNLACAQSWKLLMGCAKGRPAALDAIVAMHEEVLVGQQLDLCESPDVARMQRLKTGSYTVKGPLSLGAALGDANPDQVRALLAYAEPLGLAFQMRDDLLGTFGDIAETGKPADDLRHGKRTALIDIAEEVASADALGPVHAVLGNAAATDAEVARAKAVLVEIGAKKALEDRLEGYVADARAALTPLAEPGREMLTALADALARRKH